MLDDAEMQCSLSYTKEPKKVVKLCWCGVSSTNKSECYEFFLYAFPRKVRLCTAFVISWTTPVVQETVAFLFSPPKTFLDEESEHRLAASNPLCFWAVCCFPLALGMSEKSKTVRTCQCLFSPGTHPRICAACSLTLQQQKSVKINKLSAPPLSGVIPKYTRVPLSDIPVKNQGPRRTSSSRFHEKSKQKITKLPAFDGSSFSINCAFYIFVCIYFG